MKLPIAGQTSQGQAPLEPLKELKEWSVPRSLLLLAVPSTAAPWPWLSAVGLPIRRLEPGDRLDRRWLAQPERHELLRGTPEDLVRALGDEPQVLIGPWAARWLRPTCLVLAGSLGRHSWPTELRSLDPDLILRDLRPSVIEALCDRL